VTLWGQGAAARIVDTVVTPVRTPFLRLTLVTLTGLVGQATAADPHAEFFEKRIRPVLVEHCYKCHSLESGKDKGGLRVDSHESLVHGGGSGAAVVPGAAEKSLLLAAIKQGDAGTAMPPQGDPLPPAVIKDFES